jgi:glycosidase
LIYNGEEVGNNKKLGLFEKTDIDWSKNTDFRILYQKLSLLRKQHPALVNGSYSAVQNSSSKQVLSFIRIKEKDSVLVVLNFGSTDIKVNLVLPSNSNDTWKDFLTNRIYEPMTRRYDLALPSLGFAILFPQIKFER